MLMLRAAAALRAAPVQMRTFTAPPSLPYPRAAVAVTVLRHEVCEATSERQYLLAQRARSPGKGTWSLPGGKVNLGEGCLEAAARELLEETALGPKELRYSPWPIAATDVIVPESDENATSVAFHYVLTQFFAFAEADVEPHSGDDASSVRWATLAEVESGSFPLGGDVASVLRRAEQLLGNGALTRDEAIAVEVESVNPPGV
jgi:8-oxo-dGTP diphosphatase